MIGEENQKTLDGRVALVTGAGRGIGRATALELCRRGARVMGVARTEKELEALAQEEPSLSFIATSLATFEGCEKAVAETRARLGPISILVNNAGVSPPRAHIWEQPERVWNETMSINLHAPFYLTRLSVEDMIQSSWGRIVNLSSTAGLIGSPQSGPYDASKHGVIGLTRSVAHDVAPFNITCNAVLPGWVRTSMSERSVRLMAERRQISEAALWDEIYAINPAKRLVTEEEVAAIIGFLVTPDASGISGEAIRVALGSTE